MIEHLHLYLIVAGITIGLVLLILWRQTRIASSTHLALIRLNEQLGFDAPTFLRQAWPLLANTSLNGMTWKIDWFGIPLEGSHGTAAGEAIHRNIHVEDMRLDATLFRKASRGERRYFDEPLIETFFLLLRADMWVKAGAANAAFAQMNKLHLFLQHDMKNVAQFIQLMSDQLESAPPGAEQQLVAQLRAAAPLLRHRAERITGALSAGRTPSEKTHDIDLPAEIRQICGMYQLPCDISGSAIVRLPPAALDTALDNILKNYADVAARDGCKPDVVRAVIDETPERIRLAIGSGHAISVEEYEHLFEPFWSSRPDGLGIGLYQARQALLSCGAMLGAFRSSEGKLEFWIEFQK